MFSPQQELANADAVSGEDSEEEEDDDGEEEYYD